MMYIIGIFVFLFIYNFCYQEARCEDKYKIVLSKRIMAMLSLPANIIRRIPIINKLFWSDEVRNLSLMKACISTYLIISVLPTYIFFVIDDVDKVAGIWCVMGMFTVTAINIIYFIYDIMKEYKWIFFKICAIFFSLIGEFVFTLMCISCAIKSPIYVAITLSGTILAYIVILSTSSVEKV